MFSLCVFTPYIIYKCILVGYADIDHMLMPGVSGVIVPPYVTAAHARLLDLNVHLLGTVVTKIIQKKNTR